MATTYIPQINRARARKESDQAEGLRMSTLIVCNDQQALRNIHPVFAGTGNTLQLCADSDLAIAMLARWRFDAVVVDCDALPKAMEVMRFLRNSSSSRTAVAFALVERTSASIAFAAGASFVLNKPVSREQVRTILRAARGVILLGSRRYYRRPLVTALTFVTPTGQALKLSTANVSEGGLKIEGSRVPPQGERGTVTFRLPETEASIIAGVDVVWSKSQEAGLRFTNIADNGRILLRAWIDKSFEQELAAMKPLSHSC